MNLSLPGNYLYYLSRDNLAPKSMNELSAPMLPGHGFVVSMNLMMATTPAVTLSI